MYSTLDVASAKKIIRQLLRNVEGVQSISVIWQKKDDPIIEISVKEEAYEEVEQILAPIYSSSKFKVQLSVTSEIEVLGEQ